MMEFDLKWWNTSHDVARATFQTHPNIELHLKQMGSEGTPYSHTPIYKYIHIYIYINAKYINLLSHEWQSRMAPHFQLHLKDIRNMYPMLLMEEIRLTS